ncbi:NAD(P)/FAD-dependent oxidoreductase [Aquisalimonas sp.]|uniref:flavin monoamine oxidase family protein n=1 Tax=Aquisalimonas sp. TaxID=1872621 RepID=UPI0025C6CF63|nr:NAD(P)/FAD-dependent oxidoreductase [Aquisalimonas sp.]
MSATRTATATRRDIGPDGISMFGPDFPFAYDNHVRHPAGIGRVPPDQHGREVAVIGAGCAGLVTAFELMKLGLRPVVYEADRLGGRMRSERFAGHAGLVAELGAMRFPESSTTLFHYFDRCGLRTRPFPNPLTPASNSTVIDLKSRPVYAEGEEDLPPIYRKVLKAWDDLLENRAAFAAMQEAIRQRDVAAIKAIWNPQVKRLDDCTFYQFLAHSTEFASFRDREIFGQVGFGTGGWDTDFPNSMLEILRVAYTSADDNHRAVIGGVQQLPETLWQLAPSRDEMAHWPAGTSLALLHEGPPRPGVREIYRTHPGNITLVDQSGAIRTYPAMVMSAQVWMLLSQIRCDEALFPADHWTAIERTHYTQSSKTFVAVDRPFWQDKDPRTGRDAMSTTLTDRMTRSTYLLGEGDDRPGVICLSYTWNDDALKWLPLSASQRMDVMLESLGEIYPGVNLRRHIITDPITVSWELEPYFMGAFKANLPGHYRYQHRLFTHFMQDRLPPGYQGVFLCGDDVSWTAGWAEGAVTTALNAVWGVMRHLGGETHPDNPGPGDVFDAIAPLELDD